MRTIAGKYKRTPLVSLEGDLTRPTKDMVKEALFDALQINSEESFLDLFSGSGAIGIEAISRGAKRVIFNDSNKDAVKIIETNLKKINEVARVLNLDYEECLFKLNDEPFDYIYIDPPYAFKEYNKVFELIEKYHLLTKKGIIICEVRKDINLNDEYHEVYKYKEKKYGISKLLYFRKKVA